MLSCVAFSVQVREFPPNTPTFPKMASLLLAGGSVPSCRYPGCSRPCYKESYGRVHDFCGRTHAQEYKKTYGPYLYRAGSTTSAHSKTKSKTTSSVAGSRQPLKAIHHHSVPTTKHTSRGIKFYNRSEPYYEFTNFYPCRVFIDGKSWPTTEHYFQAQKFIGTPYCEKIRNLPNPRDAFQLSRDPQVSRWRRADWENAKDDVMLKALRVKFSENMGLRTQLLATGDRTLIEHTSNDSYWGDGGDGTGQNKLGQLLMKVRRELRIKYGSTYPSTRDDSSIQKATQPPHRLKRSNSMSSLADHLSSRAEPVTGIGLSLRSHNTGGSHRHQATPSKKPSYSDVARNTASKSGINKGVSAMRQSTSSSPITASCSHPPRGNTSSVTYNIITNK